MDENGFQTIFQEKYVCMYSWKIVRNPFACMVVFQSMWKGPNHCWNFMESGSESATYPASVNYVFLVNGQIVNLVTETSQFNVQKIVFGTLI